MQLGRAGRIPVHYFVRQRLQNDTAPENRLSSSQVRAIVDRLSEKTVNQIGESSRSVDEVARLLGATPEEISRIAGEVPVSRRQTPRFLRSPWPQLTIAGIGLLMWVFTLARSEALANAARASAFRGGPLNGSMEPVLNYDPEAKAYVRDQSQLFINPNSEELVVDESVAPPPQGFRVTLITPTARKTIAGPPGRAKDQGAARDQLRVALRSLVAYEERLGKVRGHLPVVDYVTAPWDQGSLIYPGWHDIEISNGRETFTGLLPDSRFANDTRGFVTSFEERLDWLSDVKFFSALEPANLRPGAILVHPKVAPPPGYAILMWDNEKTLWAAGGQIDRRITLTKADAEQKIRAALESFVALVGKERPFKYHAPIRDGKNDNAVNFMVEFPGGVRRSFWLLEDDPDHTSNWTLAGARKSALDVLSQGAASPFLATPPSHMTITYGEPLRDPSAH